MKHIFIGNCIDLNEKSITKMVDESDEIDYSDLLEHVDEDELKIYFPDYDWDNKVDLQFKDDYAVKFYKSIYEQMECLYIKHSSIEWVWVKYCNECTDGILIGICSTCHGSGEGMTDGSTCPVCNGTGNQEDLCSCPKRIKHENLF